MSKRFVMIVSIVLLAVFLTAGLFGCREKETSQYVTHNFKVGKDGTFKILQLTDLHFIDSKKTSKDSVANDYTLRDEWAKTAIASVIEDADPDLLIVTGDVIFTVPGVGEAIIDNVDNYSTFMKFADYVDSFDIPWLFLFGNHDEEGDLITYPSINNHDDVKRALGEYLLSDDIKNCYYVEGPKDINGVGNYIVNVLNKDGSVNNSLVLFDSGSYLQEPGALKTTHYEWVHDDQLDWYKKAITDISRLDGRDGLVPSLVFQHIPTPEYRYVIDACIEALGDDWEKTINKNGVETVIDTKLGKITYHGGVYNEGEVCCSYVGELNGKTYDGGNEFKTLKEFGSTKYIFCGHDHRNTFSMTYDGITLTYGMSIDYSANGLLGAFDPHQRIYNETEQRGGTLITLKKDSSVEIKQVPFTRNLFQEETDKRANA